MSDYLILGGRMEEAFFAAKLELSSYRQTSGSRYRCA
jgi:hypothetical protein